MKKTILIPLFIFLSIHTLFAKNSMGETSLSPLNDTGSIIYKGGVLPLSEEGEYELSTNFLLDSSIHSPSFFIAPSPYPIEVFINGISIYSWGNGKKCGTMASYSANAINIPQKILLDKNSILIKFYTDGSKTVFPQFWVGEKIIAEKEAFWQTLFNLSIIRAIALMSLFMAPMLLFYFFFSGRKNFLTLQLSFFAFSVAIGYSNFIFNNYWFNELIVFKIARFSNLLMAVSLIFLVVDISNIFTKKIYKLVLVLVFLPYGISIIFAASRKDMNHIFNLASNTLIMPLLVLGFMLLIIASFRKGDIKNRLILIFYTIFIILGFGDLSSQIKFELPYFWKIPYGYALLLFSGIIAALVERVRLLSSVKKELIRTEQKVLNLESENIIRNEIFATLTKYQEISINSTESFLVDNLLGYSSGKHPELHGFFEYTRGFKLGRSYGLDIGDESDVWYEKFDLYEHLNSFIAFYEMRENQEGEECSFGIDKTNMPQFIWGDSVVMFILYDVLLSVLKSQKQIVKCHFYSKRDVLQVEFTSPNGLPVDLCDKILKSLPIARLADNQATNYNNQLIGFFHKLLETESGNIECYKDEIGSQILVTIPVKRVEEQKL
jgi:hypothetical protein